MRKLVWLFIGCIASTIVAAQDFSNKGKEFWIAYPAHIDGTGSVMGLYLTANVNTTATIQVGPTTTLTQNITANQVTKVFLGTGGGNNATNTGVYLDMNDGSKTNAAIKVTSPQPIVVYAHIIRSARSGATLVLPTQVLGTEYILPSYQSIGTGGTGIGGRSELAVVATQNNTTIEITPSVAGIGGRPAGVAFTVTLANAGDCYQFQSAAQGDISGTTVKSISSGGSGCKPIAVYSASTWSAFDCGGASGGDNLFQQVFPNRSWGKQFVTAPFINRNYTIYRIYVQDPTTVVQYVNNGVTTTFPTSSLNAAGKFYQISTANPLQISADKPIMVTQYITSQTCNTNCNTGSSAPSTCFADPEMIILNPVEQTLSDVTFFSAHANHVPSGQTQIQTHYVNIIINKNYKASVRIDGSAPSGTFIDIPASNYAYLQADLSASSANNPIHRVTADTSFAAIVYGYGNVESYGYNGGTNVVDLYQYVTLQNPIASVNFPATCKGTPFKFSITLPYQPLSLTWDFSSATGLTPNTNIVNNAPVFDSSFVRDGRTLYVYKLAGDYTFANTGNFPIKVIVNNPTTDGCSGLQEINYDVTVYDKPTANFGFVTTGCVTDPVNFSDSTNGNGRNVFKWKWEFGDATTDSVKNPVKTYASVGTGTYNVKLTAYTDIGCVTDTTLPINLTTKPIAKFGISDTTCVAKIIAFTDSSTNVSGNIVKWYWNYGNSNIETLTSYPGPRLQTYNNAQAYNATLVTETATGCKSVLFSKTFNVYNTPNVGFILPEVCLADANAVFTDTTTIAGSNTSSLQYNWTFNVTGVTPVPTPAFSTLQNGITKYNIAGNYVVKLKVTSNGVCADSVSKAFTVNGSVPVADFEVQSPASLCSNLPVEIKNTSTVNFGTVTKTEIYWDYLGSPTIKETDDTPAPNKIYQHTYPNFQQPASKTYTIRFLAYSGGVCVNIKERTVTVYASPKVQFATLPGICLEAAPRAITQATEIGGVTGANPAFTFSGTGVSSNGLFNPSVGVNTYTIQALFTSDKGCKDSATQPITVWPTPTAKFGISSPFCEKNDLIFSDSSAANFSNIISWAYNFGDGNSTIRPNSNNFTKAYTTANTYTATLRVTTDSGCVSPIFSRTFDVKALPRVSFTLPDICLPDGRGTFNSTSTIPDNSENLFTYLWNFGDPANPTPSTLKNATHRYTNLPPSGGYNVKLRVTSKDGCVDSLTQQFNKVYPQPKAGFYTIPANGEICIGDSVRMIDTSKGISSAVTTWRWNLGNSITANTQNTSRTFNDSGRVDVKLVIFNAQGCISDTAMQTIVIHPYPKLDVGPDLFVLQGGMVQIKPTYFATNPAFKWTPATYLNNDTVPYPIAMPPTDITYRVALSGIGSCTVFDTIFIKLLPTPKIPNAFSPNGDNTNDRWEIEHLNSYENPVVEVFDRNGNIVFRSVKYSVAWDGTKNGKPLPVGTYYYIINAGNGRPTLSGSVTIIR